VSESVPLWLRAGCREHKEEDADQDGTSASGTSASSDSADGAGDHHYSYFFAAVFLKALMLQQPASSRADLVSGPWLPWLLTVRHLRQMLRRRTDDTEADMVLWGHFGSQPVRTPAHAVAVIRFRTLTLALPSRTADGWVTVSVPDSWSRLPAAAAAALLT
jgi:hypothetical protein